jgi:hypothetical protein
MGRTTIPTIRPFENYVDMSDNDVLKRSTNVVDGVGAHTDVFTAPPIAPTDLKTQNDTFSGLMAQAVDGSKKIIAQRNKVRHTIITDLRILGRYVQKVADGDMATFKLSGFEPNSAVRTPPFALSPNFRSIDHGKITGQLVIRMKAVPGALSYELRYAALVNGTPGTWTTALVTAVRPPTTINGLTPGTVYAFGVRSMAKAGYSDWSDSITMMCT